MTWEIPVCKKKNNGDIAASEVESEFFTDKYVILQNVFIRLKNQKYPVKSSRH